MAQMARRNRRRLPTELKLCSRKKEDEQVQTQSLLTLLRCPPLLLRLAIVVFNWFTCSLTYYGLSLNVGQLIGNIFLNFCLSAVFELAAYVFIVVMLTHVGRKTLYCCTLLLGGVACLLTVVPTMVGGSWEAFLIQAFALIGKFGISGAFGIIWLFTPEMFPTSLRTGVTGASSCMARIGGITASYLATLTMPGRVGQLLPQIIFGCFALVAGALALVLPETKEMDLPDSMDEAIHLSQSESQTESSSTQVTNTLLT